MRRWCPLGVITALIGVVVVTTFVLPRYVETAGWNRLNAQQILQRVYDRWQLRSGPPEFMDLDSRSPFYLDKGFLHIVDRQMQGQITTSGTSLSMIEERLSYVHVAVETNEAPWSDAAAFELGVGLYELGRYDEAKRLRHAGC